MNKRTKKWLSTDLQRLLITGYTNNYYDKKRMKTICISENGQ